MTAKQHKDWSLFRARKSTNISQEEFTMLCEMHAELFNHTFYKPCTCRPKEINKWISDINRIYDSLQTSENDNT